MKQDVYPRILLRHSSFHYLLITSLGAGAKSHTGSGGRGCVERTFWRGGIAIHAKSPLCRRTVGHQKVTLLVIVNCGIFLCSQRAALYDPHCLRSAFLWLPPPLPENINQ